MRVSGGWSRSSAGGFSRSGGGVGDASNLTRSEIVADIFNHQPVEGDERNRVRLHLSHSARVLTERMRQELQAYYKENPNVRERMEAIELPDVEGDSRGVDLSIRKLRAYVNWLGAREGAQETPVTEAELAYEQVHQLGRDDELRQLAQGGEEVRQELNARRKEHAPNYYYMMFPETYSFN